MFRDVQNPVVEIVLHGRPRNQGVFTIERLMNCVHPVE
jgi:hypothetical protein